MSIASFARSVRFSAFALILSIALFGASSAFAGAGSLVENAFLGAIPFREALDRIHDDLREGREVAEVVVVPSVTSTVSSISWLLPRPRSPRDCHTVVEREPLGEAGTWVHRSG